MVRVQVDRGTFTLQLYKGIKRHISSDMQSARHEIPASTILVNSALPQLQILFLYLLAVYPL